jgi:hypothetical protein
MPTFWSNVILFSSRMTIFDTTVLDAFLNIRRVPNRKFRAKICELCAHKNECLKHNSFITIFIFEGDFKHIVLRQEWLVCTVISA